MHDNTNSNETAVAEEQPAQQQPEPQPAEGVPEAEQQSEEDEVEESGEYQEEQDQRFGPEIGPMSFDPAMVTKLMEMFGGLLGKILGGRKNSPSYVSYEPPKPMISMPRDLALEILTDIYNPKNKDLKRSRILRMGMGIGAALGVMGTEVAYEDFSCLLSALFNLGGNKKSRQNNIADLLRGLGLQGGYHPGQAVPVAIRPPRDPIADFDSPHYRDMGDIRADPMRASGEGLGVAGIPPMEEIGPQVKEEFFRRWNLKQIENPDDVKKMKSDGFDPDRIFNHFEELFNEFWPKKPAEDEPDDQQVDEPSEES